MAPVHLLIPPCNDKVPKSFKKKRLCNDIQATWNRYFISKAVGSFSRVGIVPPTDPLAVWLRWQWEGGKAFSVAPWLGGKQGYPDRGAGTTDLSLFLVPKYLRTKAKLHLPGNFWSSRVTGVSYSANACLEFETLPAGFSTLFLRPRS